MKILLTIFLLTGYQFLNAQVITLADLKKCLNTQTGKTLPNNKIFKNDTVTSRTENIISYDSSKLVTVSAKLSQFGGAMLSLSQKGKGYYFGRIQTSGGWLVLEFEDGVYKFIKRQNNIIGN